MRTLEQFESEFKNLQEQFKTVREENVVALQKRYNNLINEFHTWSKDNPISIFADSRAHLIKESSFCIEIVNGKAKIIP
mgnify:CR=1 FL=1